ncbi:MAG TPA: GAF domain-containing protein, partial [Anaerolineales bacterium]|nr:GAF domain-containing protein [Anaerolineales bacterium]
MTTPTPAESNAAVAFSFQEWRENFLRIVLRGTVVFGLFGLLPALFTNTDPTFFVVYFISYIALLIVAFVPQIPYRFRAGTFIALFYILGLSGLLDTGIWGDSRVFFVALVVITGLLISPRAAINAGIISLVTTGIVAGLVLTGMYQLTTKVIPGGDSVLWLSGIGTIIMLDAIMITGLTLFQREFEKAQQRNLQSLNALEAERDALEKNMELRASEALKKTSQLQAASKVARQIAEIRDLQTLLTNISVMVADQFNFYHVGVFLLDDKQQYAVLQAASSEGGRRMLQAGHRLEVGVQGIVGYVADRGRPRIALDVGADAVFFNNPYLPLTHSEMALPLIAREKTIGVLDAQSERPQAFTRDDIEVLQTVADQLAIAIENARLLSETEAIISQFEALTSYQTTEAWENYLKERMPGYQYTPLGIRPLSNPAQQQTQGKVLRIPIKLRGQEIGFMNLTRKDTSPNWSAREQEMIEE